MFYPPFDTKQVKFFLFIKLKSAILMQEWGISFLDAPVPEQMKYASLAEAASHLIQVLNDPEHITG